MQFFVLSPTCFGNQQLVCNNCSSNIIIQSYTNPSFQWYKQKYTWVFPKIGCFPKSSMLIGFSIIFTIHFGVPLFLEIPTFTWCTWVFSRFDGFPKAWSSRLLWRPSTPRERDPICEHRGFGGANPQENPWKRRLESHLFKPKKLHVV